MLKQENNFYPGTRNEIPSHLLSSKYYEVLKKISSM